MAGVFGLRVLVVEDERQLADSIAEGLRLHAMAVDVAYDGAAGLDRALVNDYDVLVLDRDSRWFRVTRSAPCWCSPSRKPASSC